MKLKNKKLPLYIVGLTAFLLMGAAYSATAMLEIGPIATITADRPQIRFIDTNGGEDWVIDAVQPGRENRLVLGLLDDVQPTGSGPLIIDQFATEGAMVVKQGGVIVNEREFTHFDGETGSDYGELIVKGRNSGFDAAISIVPDDYFAQVAEITVGPYVTGLSPDPNDPNSFLENVVDMFSISTKTEGRSDDLLAPFLINLEAPNAAFRIDAQGNVGLGAGDFHDLFLDTPELDELQGKLHIRGDNIYFDSYGPRWDWLVSADDDVYSVTSIDVPRGISTVPFEVQTGAPDDSFVLDDDGNIGMGISWADSPLHVFREDGTASLKVEDASPTVALRPMMELVNNGGVSFALDNTDQNERWIFSNNTRGDFNISRTGTGGSEMSVSRTGRLTSGPGGFLALDSRPNGNLFIAGTLFESSDRNKKENFEEVDCEAVLDQIVNLPITTWNYKTDDEAIRHMGPVAQDFRSAFKLGDGDKTIATTDKAGVSLAAIKALNSKLVSKLEEKDEEIDELKVRLEKLESIMLNNAN